MHKIILISSMLVSLLACAEPQSESDTAPVPRPTATALASGLTLTGNGDELCLSYVRGEKVEGPRVVELFIRHSGNLSFESVTPGDAATAAGKDVIVQAKDPQTLRVLLFSSSNTTSLESGTLATIHLSRVYGKARAEILLDKPMFAPQSAQDGLAVSDPIDF